MIRYMTYPEFVTLARGIDCTVDRKEPYSMGIQWVVGGQAGGSCWDEGDYDPHFDVEPENKPKFSKLKLLLNAMCGGRRCPAHIKARAHELLKESVWTLHEYYGNYTQYRIEYVELRPLYDLLMQIRIEEMDKK